MLTRALRPAARGPWRNLLSACSHIRLDSTSVEFCFAQRNEPPRLSGHFSEAHGHESGILGKRAALPRRGAGFPAREPPGEPEREGAGPEAADARGPAELASHPA